MDSPDGRWTALGGFAVGTDRIDSWVLVDTTGRTAQSRHVTLTHARHHAANVEQDDHTEEGTP
jgi:hypothetical protein